MMKSFNCNYMYCCLIPLLITIVLSIPSAGLQTVESPAAQRPSQNWPSDETNNGVKLTSPSKVQVHLQDKHVVLDNGLVQLTLSSPDGLITGIQFNGVENLLEYHNAEDNRGYWDVVWGTSDSLGVMDLLKTTDFRIIEQTEKQVEVSFTRKWNPLFRGKFPVNVDKRYVMLSGSSGFYTYAILEHGKGWPAFRIDEARIALKLSEERFQYMALDDNRQRIMPTFEDRQNGQPLAYPEAVLLIHPANPSLKGEVDDKYQYSMDNIDNRVHGWICSKPPTGLWMITASDEFRTGGPFKQDLTSHSGPTTLSMFISKHYTGEDLAPQFHNGEPWKKVFGPNFIYLNAAPPSQDPHTFLWEDAVGQMTKELQNWPYSFLASDDLPSSDKRGAITGKLLVHDKFISEDKMPANLSYVGLAPPGDAGSWQRECKGYQFWTKADARGSFSIRNIRPGTYNLFAYVPGFIGDYKYPAAIKIAPGLNVNLGVIVYEPPRDGRTLWEIGIPDRTAAEFNVPRPLPQYLNKLYRDRPNWFRQYGLWEKYIDLYPNIDLVYTIGVSTPSKDWFYAHIPRKQANYTFTPATWQIIFKLNNVIKTGTYKLRLAIASATYAELQVRFNNQKAKHPHFTTGVIGKDNAIARHGIHGLYWLFSVDVPGSWLLEGRNTIFLTQTKTSSIFFGFMYDYLRLEAPSEDSETSSSESSSSLARSQEICICFLILLVLCIQNLREYLY